MTHYSHFATTLPIQLDQTRVGALLEQLEQAARTLVRCILIYLIAVRIISSNPDRYRTSQPRLDRFVAQPHSTAEISKGLLLSFLTRGLFRSNERLVSKQLERNEANEKEGEFLGVLTEKWAQSRSRFCAQSVPVRAGILYILFEKRLSVERWRFGFNARLPIPPT